jgi:TrmH family RNA methyltransferase
MGPDRFRELVPRQPAIGIAGLVSPREFDAPLEHTPGLWLALRHVRQAGNLGTLIRSVDALGTRGLICLGRTLDPWDPNVQRAAMGSALRVPLARMTHRSLAAWASARPDWQIVGADGDPDHPILRAHDWRRPTIVLLWHERHGLDEEDRELCQ